MSRRSGSGSRLGFVMRLGPVQDIIWVLPLGGGPVQQVRDQLNRGLLKKNRPTAPLRSHDRASRPVSLQCTQSSFNAPTCTALLKQDFAPDGFAGRHQHRPPVHCQTSDQMQTTPALVLTTSSTQRRGHTALIVHFHPQALATPLKDQGRRHPFADMLDDVRGQLRDKQRHFLSSNRHPPLAELRDGGSPEQSDFRRRCLERQDTARSGFGDFAAEHGDFSLPGHAHAAPAVSVRLHCVAVCDRAWHRELSPCNFSREPIG